MEPRPRRSKAAGKDLAGQNPGAKRLGDQDTGDQDTGDQDTGDKTKRNGSVRWVVGASAELPEKGRIVVDLDGMTVGVFRVGGALYAYENTCPHMDGPVCQGLIVPAVNEVLDEKRAIKGSVFDESDMRVCCPWHGMEFSITTGTHPVDPRLRLRKIPVSEHDGRIYLEV